MTRYRLTTVDNPWDPFDNFDSWYYFDTVILKRNSCGLLDRIAHTSDSLSDYENEQEIKRAIQQIVEFDLEDVYYMVSKDFDEKEVVLEK